MERLDVEADLDRLRRRAQAYLVIAAWAEAGALTGIVVFDRRAAEEVVALRGGDVERLLAKSVRPDPGADYAASLELDLAQVEPMLARPGDPKNAITLAEFRQSVSAPARIDIAYAGSCTAGKEYDLDQYARVLSDALESGRGVAPGVRMVLQFGSAAVREYARARGYLEVFERAGVEVIEPGCGACIGCGPGVSESPEQVTISAINRNFQGRSGPGKLYLASPLSVAASAVEGRIVSYKPGMFRQPATV